MLKYAKWFFVGLSSVAAWTGLAIYLAINGVWMSSVVAQGNTVGFYEWAVDQIELKNKGNTALVLLEDGAVVQQF